MSALRQAHTMNLIYAQVVGVYPEDGAPMGKVNHWGVIRAVPLHLVPETRPGDTVLVCDGVAIAKVNNQAEQPIVTDERQSVAQASPPASSGGVPLPGCSIAAGGTPAALAGRDACATVKGAKDVSGSPR
jgi:hydrogenase maturation factor